MAAFFIVLSLIIFSLLFSVLRFSEIRDLYTKTALVSEINHYFNQAKIARIKLFYILDEKNASNMMKDEKNASNMMKYVSQIVAQQEKARQLRWQESDVQHFQRLSEQLTQYQHELEEIVLAVSALRGQKQVLPAGENIQNTAQWQRLKAADTQSIKTGLAVTDTLIRIASQLYGKNQHIITAQSRKSLLSGFAPFCWEC
ncbi:MAG: hypothetical protein ACR5LC_11070 [Symbiopectobacterium sp.]